MLSYRFSAFPPSTRSGFEGWRLKISRQGEVRASELYNAHINPCDTSNRHLIVFGKGSKERILPFCALLANPHHKPSGATPNTGQPLLTAIRARRAL